MTEDAHTAPRDHGGDMDRARRLYGDGAWLDLSTGINALPYPLPEIPPQAWTALPTRAEIAGLEAAARTAYRTRACVVALAGAQAAIQLVPRLAVPGESRILVPTYNEHAGALRAQGWQVREVSAPGDLEGADLAVVVSPNNPDGRRMDADALLDLSRTVGLLVVDESFADPTQDTAFAPHLDSATDGIVVLRSFGKFYGLAGLRLGFALAGADLGARLRALAGPWAVSGPAIHLGRAALADTAWQRDTARRLAADAERLDALAERAGWARIGGTPLFRTYGVGDAAAVQDALARRMIWTRIFPYSKNWLRLGLPGDAESWDRLARAMDAL